MALARVTTKGQVTIPAESEKPWISAAGDDLLFEVVEAGEARIRVLKRGRLSDLYGALPPHAPTLEGRGSDRGGPGAWGPDGRDRGRESALDRRQRNLAVLNRKIDRRCQKRSARLMAQAREVRCPVRLAAGGCRGHLGAQVLLPTLASRAVVVGHSPPSGSTTIATPRPLFMRGRFFTDT